MQHFGGAAKRKVLQNVKWGKKYERVKVPVNLSVEIFFISTC